MKTTNSPIFQEFHIEGVKHIAPEEALKVLSTREAVLIDVREEYEAELESIPLDNVVNHPMSVILDRLSCISKDQHIILGCPGGVRSTKVANLMNRQGYPHVANLDGGFTTWKAKGFPCQFRLDENLAGGCGCNCKHSVPSNGRHGRGCC